MQFHGGTRTRGGGVDEGQEVLGSLERGSGSHGLQGTR